MDKIVVTSMRQSAGKTSVIIGIARALNKKVGYMKPFGERLLYRKKRLWDYDAALVANIFELEENIEDMSIGFHHSKLLYMLDEEMTRQKLLELLTNMGNKKDIVFVEAGKDISYGSSVYLDALSMAKYLDSELLVVASGDEDTILDDITFLKKRVQMENIKLRGVIINKVANITEFTDIHLAKIKQLGVNVLGVIPYYKDLPFFSVSYLADRLFAKVIAGENNLHRIVKNVFIGSVSASAAMKNPLFQAEDKVVITSGDRGDMIVSALGSNSAAIILTNNILPPPNLIDKAEKHNVPLLLVSLDAFQVAKQIDALESLPTKEDKEKIKLIESMITTHVNLKDFQR
ncbi:MAG TPA: AAA family ATPase [Smithellaceae bacterium]|nr:AAA family ATPase [Smithellaceae bacterium]